ATSAYHCPPYHPHAIARLRIGAYEKASVMQYIDNLLDWGDMQFRRYTWESITTATMYYVYAWNLLGPRPQSVGDCTSAPPKSYQEISDAYQNEIPEFLIQLETVTPPDTVSLPTSHYNELDRLRSTQEKAILNLSTKNFEQQIEEQKSLIEAVTQQKKITENRKQRYQKLIDGGRSSNETASITLLSLAEIPVTISALCIQI